MPWKSGHLGLAGKRLPMPLDRGQVLSTGIYDFKTAPLDLDRFVVAGKGKRECDLAVVSKVFQGLTPRAECDAKVNPSPIFQDTRAPASSDLGDHSHVARAHNHSNAAFEESP